MGSSILITGANRGLGLSLTDKFLEIGYQVYALSRKESFALKTLKDKYNGSLHMSTVDVTNLEAIGLACETINQITSSIDILVNNAAVHLENPPPDLKEIDFTKIALTFEINSIGPLKVIQQFLPLVRNSPKKLIVNISSEAGSITNSWRDREYGYCMSKAALNMMSSILQKRLKEYEIKVLAVHPQWFSSDMGGSSAPISPDIAAEYVIKTILKEWKLEDPIYIDSKTQTQMKW